MQIATTFAIALTILAASLLLIAPNRPVLRAELSPAPSQAAIFTQELTLIYGHKLETLQPNGI